MDEIIYLTDFKQKSFKLNDKSSPRDFNYGIDLLRKNYKVSFYDIGKLRFSRNSIFKAFSKLSYIFLGVYGTLNFELIKFYRAIPKETKIICANDGIGICCLLINYLLKKNFKIYILSMGFYSKYFYKRNKLSYIRKIAVNLLLNRSTNILFLGIEELLFLKGFSKNRCKVSLLRFRIDDFFGGKEEKNH